MVYKTRESSAVAILKVLCDTDALFPNIRDEKSEGQRQALKKLLEMRAAGHLVLLRSEVNRVEISNTKNKEQRDKLEAAYMALDPVHKEENVSNFSLIPGPTGSFILNPASDLDPAAYQDCRARGLSDRDTLHILRAVENACDVFLTRDVKTIIRPHRDWLQQRFSGLKIRLPSELVAELLP
jgi:hypothetical protein